MYRWIFVLEFFSANDALDNALLAEVIQNGDLYFLFRELFGNRTQNGNSTMSNPMDFVAYRITCLCVFILLALGAIIRFLGLMAWNWCKGKGCKSLIKVRGSRAPEPHMIGSGTIIIVFIVRYVCRIKNHNSLIEKCCLCCVFLLCI